MPNHAAYRTVECAHVFEGINFVVAGHRVIGRIERHRNLPY